MSESDFQDFQDFQDCFDKISPTLARQNVKILFILRILFILIQTFFHLSDSNKLVILKILKILKILIQTDYNLNA